MKFVFIAAIFLLSILSRWVPHPENWTAMGALFLFSGAFIENARLRWAVPLLAMVVSDLVLGFHALSIVVYAALALNILIGVWLQTRPQWGALILGTVGGALLFFFVTNFAHWCIDFSYERSVAGLTAAYLQGLPFLLRLLIGDLLYAHLFFGAYRLMFERPSFQMKSI